jgi:hypothetical protein
MEFQISRIQGFVYQLNESLIVNPTSDQTDQDFKINTIKAG